MSRVSRALALGLALLPAVAAAQKVTDTFIGVAAPHGLATTADGDTWIAAGIFLVRYDGTAFCTATAS